MSTNLERIYQILDGVLPSKVSYGTNVVDVDEENVLPFIVYQEVSKRPVSYADDRSVIRVSTVQITLITEIKDQIIELSLEEALYLNGYNYQMITEYLNDDDSVNRVYEIKMEESTL
jgi:hypothetical protein